MEAAFVVGHTAPGKSPEHEWLVRLIDGSDMIDDVEFLQESDVILETLQFLNMTVACQMTDAP